MKQTLHKKILIDILIKIYQDPFLAHNLFFKGGTALYLFHGLPRFSTDLDFDLNPHCLEKEKAFEMLKKILYAFGHLRESTPKRNTFFFLLSYEEFERTIKIEVSSRDFGIWDYDMKNVFGIDVKVLKLELLCAHKLVALLERRKARDLFDAYYILENELPINENIIHIRTGEKMPSFFKLLEKKVEREFSRKNVLHELGEMIEEPKKNWVRDHLKNAVIRLLRGKLK